MVKLGGLFRRRAATETKKAAASSTTTTTTLTTTCSLGRKGSVETVETEHTDESVRSVDIITTPLERQAASPQRSRNGYSRNTRTRKRVVRFGRDTVYDHYTRLDDDIVTNKDIWWDTDELDACLKKDFKALLTIEQRRLRTFPRAVQDLAHAVSVAYSPSVSTASSLTSWNDQVQAALQATADWRGLEDYMGMDAHHELRDAHIHAVLQNVSQTMKNKQRNATSGKARRHGIRRHPLVGGSSCGGVVLAIAPLPASLLAQQMAWVRAQHDAQQVVAAK